MNLQKFQGHYGLAFVLETDPVVVEEVAKRLEKQNRHRVQLTEADRRRLRIGLESRHLVRRRRERVRRARFPR